MERRDLIIIGAGPAGLSAGIYAARGKLDTLILEKAIPGGQIMSTVELSNYPGLPNTGGFEFAEGLKAHAESFGAVIRMEEVISVDFSEKWKKVVTDHNEYEAKTVIISSGAKPKKMNVPGEEEFVGRGISYCATCDAAFYEGQDVYIIGGGDVAVEEAIYIANFAKKVTIIHRRDELRAAKSIQEKARAHSKIHYMWDTVVLDIQGDGRIDRFTVEDIKTRERRVITSKDNKEPFGIFVLIGFEPETAIYEEALELEDGYILTDNYMATSIPGVFAAGDIRHKRIRQVVTATSDGAIAAVEAEKYIEDNF